MADNPPVQRRLAAILAADVAGYSRLMGADEEGTLARIKAIRTQVIDPSVAEHHGRIVKTTGDGLLVEFGSVVDAMRCATEWQGGMAERSQPADSRIQFRIGVNLGDIIIDGDDIHGDGVNIAARLEVMAEPGGICISHAVLTQTRGKLNFPVEDLGDQALKNIAQPVHVFRVSAEQKPMLQPAALPLPDKPSIAVLPFQNMSGDPEQEYFVDGMVEEIITALSRIRWLFVIARNSTFTYKGRPVDVKEVGRELGVRYVLEGSVRKGGKPGAHHRPADRCPDRHPPLGRPLRRLDRRRVRASGQNRRQRCRRDRAGIASGRDAPLHRAANHRPHRLRSLPARARDHLSNNERADIRGFGIARTGDRA
ncbi:MAG TPA: adenylate/guanylate cyclase domain-containing protein [Stellaceae bacterium]